MYFILKFSPNMSITNFPPWWRKLPLTGAAAYLLLVSGCAHGDTAHGDTAISPMLSQPLSVLPDEKPTSAERVAFDVLISRHRQLLMEAPALPTEKLRAWIAALGPGGCWPDIDYADKTVATWKTSVHLQRVLALCRALVDPKNPLYDDDVATAAVNRSLDLWLEAKYQNPNWWHNQIGVPMMMRDILVLLGDRLQGPRFDEAIAVLHQHGEMEPGNAANSIWVAQLGLMEGALTHNVAEVARRSKLISDELGFNELAGVQSDYSYHAHGPRLQQFHYGGAFVGDGARIAWELHDTPWAFPAEKMRFLANYILEGGQWMARGVHTVPATIDRAISREGAGKLTNGDLRPTARFLREALPDRAAEFDALIARQNGTGAPLVGYRAFPRSDFTTYHRPQFSFFLKTLSDRTRPSESINGENALGAPVLSHGDHYLVRDGQEYADMMPVWDWNLLPGLTRILSAPDEQKQPFVGSVSDGISGATAMDLRWMNKAEANQALGARKFWAMHGDVIVALIGDLSEVGSAEPVRTALDQCLLHGPVTVAGADGQTRVLPAGYYDSLPIRWVYHEGFAYVPLGGLPVSLKLGPVTGSWRLNNVAGSTTPVTQPVFLPVLEHGRSPQSQSSGFVILACDSPSQAAQLVNRPSWLVLRNDADCQAVRFDDGTFMAAFYAPGPLLYGTQKLIAVDKPCLIFSSSDGEIWASDPTQKGLTVNMTIGAGEPLPVKLPSDGTSVKVATSR